MKDRFYIKGLGINITNINKTVDIIIHAISKRKSNYICVLDSRAAYYAIKNEYYRRIQNNSLITIPDGKSLVLIANLRGLKEVKKTSGPKLFRRICEISEKKGYTHFFYGSTPDVIEKMTNNLKMEFKDLKIKGALSPKFGSPEELANDEIVKQINSLEPDILWIGLGAPKQEIFASLIKDRLKSTLMIGIGLVFDYEAGTVKRPPEWLSDLGLEWVYRMSQQRNKIIGFINPFFFFVKLIIIEFFKNIFNI